MKVRRLISAMIIGILAMVLASCGGQSLDMNCLTGIAVSPDTTAADHLMPTPGNQQQFSAFAQMKPGCSTVAASQAALTSVTWSVSNTQDATISNAPDATFGTATCRNGTNNPVTVTAMLSAGGQIFQGAASLSCR